jgi:AraC-like DNA-binding protein
VAAACSPAGARIWLGARRTGQRAGPHGGADVRGGDSPAHRDAAAAADRLARGLRDPVVGQALAALHGRPAADWTVESLARTAGVSRSVLADRFAEMVGQPPMQYLALWRMQLASQLLLTGEHVAAFSRVFKKLVGEAPSAWRRSSRARASGTADPEGRASAGP